MPKTAVERMDIHIVSLRLQSLYYLFQSSPFNCREFKQADPPRLIVAQDAAGELSRCRLFRVMQEITHDLAIMQGLYENFLNNSEKLVDSECLHEDDHVKSMHFCQQILLTQSCRLDTSMVSIPENTASIEEKDLA